MGASASKILKLFYTLFNMLFKQYLILFNRENPDLEESFQEVCHRNVILTDK